ncbi:MAG: DNA/RNA non-specific endonuclease [Bacteroidales bacterium]|jgi:endonuclease G|nr:DNA/RNA non-specific endonuclease [Bacteroidales bacterium]MCI2122454.1 DNA/RNA non-specific endonuclease [Bacteroidales bacterium]MCI2145110.1 DNA/RNA non-specific endonuclease [Bacteroidales bacterium]
MKIRLLKDFGLTALVIFSLAGCKSPGGGKIKVENKVTLQNDSVPYNTTGQFLSIESSCEWSANVSAGWCTLLNSSGSGEASDVITMTVNPLYESRKVDVTVTFGDGEVITVTLTQGPAPVPGPPVQDPDTLVSDPVRNWMELPAFKQEKDVALIEHFCTLNGSEVRNFSCCYDAVHRISTWVAYPLYDAFLGSASRTNDWGYDPEVPESLQPVLFKGIRGYDRGHQMPSADRTCSEAINRTTFYFTNMTPQNSSLNQGVWMNLEIMVRDWSATCDTLYVVSGCVLATKDDSAITYVQDNEGDSMAVPKAYYKVLLRYRISSGSYSAIGFWYENKSGYDEIPSVDQSYSVREIEDRTGVDFFPNLPDDIEDSVETEYKPANWL